MFNLPESISIPMPTLQLLYQCCFVTWTTILSGLFVRFVYKSIRSIPARRAERILREEKAEAAERRRKEDLFPKDWRDAYCYCRDSKVHPSAAFNWLDRWIKENGRDLSPLSMEAANELVNLAGGAT